MNSNLLKRFLIFNLCLTVVCAMTACGGGGGGDSSSSVGDSSSVGTLSISLTDATTDQYKAIYITVARVEVHDDDGESWQTVAEPQKTYNLLDLINGVRETLGTATLDTGHYTQMRLIIGSTADSGLNLLSKPHPFANYIVDLEDDEVHELKTPSGTQTGLKVVNGFDINENQTTELILDFNAMHSVVIASSGKYLLKPTVKVLSLADYAVVFGIVMDIPPTTTPQTAATALPGALVTAQAIDLISADLKDQVVIEGGTMSDENGEYTLFMAPESYNLVATKDGYLPDCYAVTLAAGNKIAVDFPLETATAAPGTITGTVTIGDSPSEQWATIDFRQENNCGNGMTMITVKSVNIGDGSSYIIDLPPGNYTVVASTYGKNTQSTAISVASGASITHSLIF